MIETPVTDHELAVGKAYRWALWASASDGDGETYDDPKDADPQNAALISIAWSLVALATPP